MPQLLNKRSHFFQYLGLNSKLIAIQKYEKTKYECDLPVEPVNASTYKKSNKLKNLRSKDNEWSKGIKIVTRDLWSTWDFLPRSRVSSQADKDFSTMLNAWNCMWINIIISN